MEELDRRIESVMVSGYFQNRERVWGEPIYRNVWGLLTEFGDAELAGMVAPRPLVVEACSVPEVVGPPLPREGRRAGAAPGRIETATLGAVRSEFDRAEAIYAKLGKSDQQSVAIFRFSQRFARVVFYCLNILNDIALGTKTRQLRQKLQCCLPVIQSFGE